MLPPVFILLQLEFNLGLQAVTLLENCLLNWVLWLVHLQDSFQMVLELWKLLGLIICKKLTFLVIEARLIHVEDLGDINLLNIRWFISTFML